LKVVLDTNVVVSALLFGGETGRLIELWKNGNITPLVSAAMMAEYLRVLAYPKFRLTEEEIRHLTENEILPRLEPMSVQEGEHYVRADPEDDKFIWCALAGEAEAIVSGDPHLLACTNSPVPVLSPAALLRKMAAE